MLSDGTRLKEKFDGFKKEYNERITVVKDIQDNLGKLKLYTADHQEYFGLKIVEKEILTYQTFLETQLNE